MPYAQGTHKVCSRCKENKFTDEFTKNRSEKDDLYPYCRECKSIYRSDYRVEHPDRSEREKTIAKLWSKEHSQRVAKLQRISGATRRAQKLNQFIEDVDPCVVYQMHGGMCGICEQFVPEDDFHVDHVIPLSKGGMHGYVNVQPAHPFCNWSKHDKILV